MIGIIVAYDRNKTIGKNGEIPWKIKGEQKQFKELTTGNIIVMGRKTYEDIGKPLPNRINVIISSTMNPEEDFYYDEENNLYIFNSIKDFIDQYNLANSIFRIIRKSISDFRRKDLYAIGGKRIFEEFLNLATVIYTTEIDHEYKGDVKFPNFNNKFIDVDSEVIEAKDELNNIRVTYTRKKYIKQNAQ